MKVDVAIQSFNKPESLVYSLLSLHKYSKDSVDTIWINDDCSKEKTLDIYNSLELKEALNPWQIRTRKNTHRMYWWRWFVKGVTPAYVSRKELIQQNIRNLIKTGHFRTIRQNIRYQWAIDSTDKKYLFLMHDDILFRDDVVGLYLEEMGKINNPAIVGDLGQCWRCDFKQMGCTPARILMGEKPYADWPNENKNNSANRYACRINEWCALLEVNAAKQVESKDKIFFGNYDDGGDIGAYWFARAISMGYGFSDPLYQKENIREIYYQHCWQGFSGHSVWANQGQGRSAYDPEMITRKIEDEFGVSIPGLNGYTCLRRV